MSAWLTIAGIGEDGFAGLGARAREALASAKHVVARIVRWPCCRHPLPSIMNGRSPSLPLSSI